MSRFQFIEQKRVNYPVQLLCQTLRLSSARYYAWRKQQRPDPAQPMAEPWEAALKEAFGQHKRCYGTRRLRVELQAQGHRVGRQRLQAARAAGASAPTLHSAHHRLDPRAALRP